MRLAIRRRFARRADVTFSPLAASSNRRASSSGKASGSRPSWQRAESAIHHEDIDGAPFRQAEGIRQSADDGEAEALPESDGALIAAADEIELHRLEAER